MEDKKRLMPACLNCAYTRFVVATENGDSVSCLQNGPLTKLWEKARKKGDETPRVTSLPYCDNPPKFKAKQPTNSGFLIFSEN